MFKTEEQQAQSDDDLWEEVESTTSPEKVIDFFHSLTQLPEDEDDEEEDHTLVTSAKLEATKEGSNDTTGSGGGEGAAKRVKREPAKRQTSLDRFYQQPSESSANSNDPRHHPFLSADGTLCRVVIGSKLLVFKVNESFKLKSPNFKGSVCTIEKMFRKGLNIKASCKVFMPLAMNNLLDLKEMGGFGQTHCYYYKDFLLKSLGEQVTENIPTSDLKYSSRAEEPHGNLVKNKDIDVSFEFDKHQTVIAIPNVVRSLDLFAGCGGFSIGLRNAKFQPATACEISHAAASAYRVNHGRDCILYEEDANVMLQRCRENDPSYPQKGDIQHLHCSPSCCGFSLAKWFPGKDDQKNNETSKLVVEGTEVFSPDTLTMENVLNMLDVPSGNIEYVRYIVSRLLVLRYQVRITSLDSSDFGDPQKRIRLVLFASKEGHLLPNFPTKTYGAPNLPPIRVAKDALKDLEQIEPRPKDTSGIVGLRTGQRVTNHDLQELPSYAVPLDGDRPCPTIITTTSLKHYSLDRALTIREYARLQSFPDDFIFPTNYRIARKLIGNAVPIMLATAVAKAVHKCYFVTTNDDLEDMDDDFMNFEREEPNDAANKKRAREVEATFLLLVNRLHQDFTCQS